MENNWREELKDKLLHKDNGFETAFTYVSSPNILKDTTELESLIEQLMVKQKEEVTGKVIGFINISQGGDDASKNHFLQYFGLNPKGGVRWKIIGERS